MPPSYSRPATEGSSKAAWTAARAVSQRPDGVVFSRRPLGQLDADPAHEHPGGGDQVSDDVAGLPFLARGRIVPPLGRHRLRPGAETLGHRTGPLGDLAHG